MFNLSHKLILLSFILTAGSTAGGWGMTYMLAGDSASSVFLHIGAGVAVSIVSLQGLFYFLSKQRLIYHLMFGIAFGLSLVWFMLCLILPVFWIDAVGANNKLLIIIFLVFLGGSNVAEALRRFNCKWSEKGERLFCELYKANENRIDWEKVIEPMKLSVTLYVPGIPNTWTPFLSAAIAVSMLLALNLRHVSLTFSVSAWATASAIVASIFVQLIGFGVAQVLKIDEKEKSIGRKIRYAR